MPSKPPKPQKAPFEQNQTETNTYGSYSIADSPEAQAFLGAPLDFGDPTNVDPGVAGRTALNEQEVENRYGSAFNYGVPSFVREGMKARELRDVRARGADEAQRAQYLNQQGNNAMRAARTTANIGRLQTVLPQILRMGGTGSTSGYSTQFPQSQPSFWQQFALAAMGNANQAARYGAGG